ncbi:MAG: ParB/RepB/Spo0J family partition protein [Gammaproteobacteria bacterium]|nr:ParB/RepB/Spo0J family partition protein [Gammaproteobacteria bacterium]
MPIKRGLPTTLKMRHDRHYVEELSSSRGASIGRMISVDKLEPNPHQPRVDIGDLSDLIASIKEKGVLEPLLVRPSQVGGRYMIISGERRYRAACEAGLREVPCIEMDVDDRAVAEIALIENLQRKDLTPYEEAEGLQALVERFGYTHDDVAHKIGKSRPSVTEALKIAALPVEVREGCQRANITSKSMLLQVAKQSSPKAMLDFVSRVSKQGMTRDEARKAGKRKQSRPQPYVYRYRSPGNEYTVEIKFRKSSVDRNELLQAVERLIDELRESQDLPAGN